MADKSYWAAKCARCGHPRGKHTGPGGDGCTMRTGGKRHSANGRTINRMRDCECRAFTEKEV